MSRCIQKAELNFHLVFVAVYSLLYLGCNTTEGESGFKVVTTDRADTVHDLGARRVDLTSDSYTYIPHDSQGTKRCCQHIKLTKAPARPWRSANSERQRKEKLVVPPLIPDLSDINFAIPSSATRKVFKRERTSGGEHLSPYTFRN